MLASQTNVTTEKAERYLKALCNHFNRKVTAEYTDNHGTVQFGFAYCEMDASSNELVIQIQADSEDNFNRAKFVVADHLVRFSGEDDLQVEWVDQA